MSTQKHYSEQLSLELGQNPPTQQQLIYNIKQLHTLLTQHARQLDNLGRQLRDLEAAINATEALDYPRKVVDVAGITDAL